MKIQIKYILALAIIFVMAGGIDVSAETVYDGVIYDYSYDASGNRFQRVLGYEDTGKDEVFIPSEVDGIPVKIIRAGAFRGSNFKSVKISENVTTIENSVFRDCSNLKSIEIPNSVTEIGECAFFNCSSLEKIEALGSITTVESQTFLNCSSLKSVTIPDSVTNIESSAFVGCSSLESVAIPNGVTLIGYAAFCRCSKLQNIEFPNSITGIGGDAFKGCKKLKDIEIPNGVTKIEEGAFSGCSSLKSVEIPNSVTKILWDAFKNCSSMKSITIFNKSCKISTGQDEWGENVISKTAVIYGYSGSTAEKYAKKYHRKFVALDGDAKNTPPAVGKKLTDKKTKAKYIVTKSGSTVAYAGTTDKKASSVSIPATVKIGDITYKVTSIADKAFASRKKIESITIGKNVTRIGSKAFSKCTGLTKITVPSKVNKIGEQAFAGCKNLKNITIQTTKLTEKNVGSKAFSGIHKKAKIKVPKSRLSAYKKLLKARGIGSKVKVVK